MFVPWFGCLERDSLRLALRLQMAKQQKLSGGAISELKRWTNPHRKCQSKVWCFTADIPPEEISWHNIYRLCSGKEEITGNYRSINWSKTKGEFLE